LRSAATNNLLISASSVMTATSAAAPAASGAGGVGGGAAAAAGGGVDGAAAAAGGGGGGGVVGTAVAHCHHDAGMCKFAAFRLSSSACASSLQRLFRDMASLAHNAQTTRPPQVNATTHLSRLSQQGLPPQAPCGKDMARLIFKRARPWTAQLDHASPQKWAK
jgi:hypothetical protein